MMSRSVTIVFCALLSSCLISCESGYDRRGYRYGCPRSVPGCECVEHFTNGEMFVKLTCRGFANTNIYQFRNNLKHLEGFEIDELEIDDYRPSRLPENAFVTDDGNVSALVHSLAILNSPELIFFSGIGAKNQTFFDGLEVSLEQLRLENTRHIDRLEWPRVANSLGRSGQTRLRRLLLTNTGIAFRLFEFARLVRLERIVLRQNEIQSIEADLEPFPNLQLLDLSANRIVNFSPRGNAPALTTLNLQNNRISYLDKNIFDKMPNVRLIDLTANNLSCLCTDIGFIVDNPILQKIVRGTCTTPRHLEGLPLEECSFGDGVRR